MFFQHVLRISCRHTELCQGRFKHIAFLWLRQRGTIRSLKPSVLSPASERLRGRWMTDEIKEMQDDRAESPVQKHISEIIYGTHSHT